MAEFLSNDCMITLSSGYAAAGTGTTNGTGVDCRGYDGVLIIGVFGTAAADNLVHAESSADDSTYADIASSEVDAGTSDEIQVIDIALGGEPANFYIRPVAVRATSSTLVALITMRYKARSRATVLAVAGTLALKQLIQPVQGTK